MRKRSADTSAFPSTCQEYQHDDSNSDYELGFYAGTLKATAILDTREEGPYWNAETQCFETFPLPGRGCAQWVLLRAVQSLTHTRLTCRASSDSGGERESHTVHLQDWDACFLNFLRTQASSQVILACVLSQFSSSPLPIVQAPQYLAPRLSLPKKKTHLQCNSSFTSDQASAPRASLEVGAVLCGTFSVYLICELKLSLPDAWAA